MDIAREIEEGGLSPRGRGNHNAADLPPHRLRSIPAWAGEPPFARPKPSSARVYPRVGGGTKTWLAPGRSTRGLSPRGRGNRPASGRCVPPRRSIPAWAGEPLGAVQAVVYLGVYPRVGGGTGDEVSEPPLLDGLSPRGRGNQCWAAERPLPHRSIPAWAGEPGTADKCRGLYTVYPRVGGGTL